MTKRNSKNDQSPLREQESPQRRSWHAHDLISAVTSLLRPGAQWIDDKGIAWPMTPQDVLVVAPYNSQVALLEERLGPKGVRAGTVDKFQGQEAPVVIYSMTTSVPRQGRLCAPSMA